MHSFRHYLWTVNSKDCAPGTSNKNCSTTVLLLLNLAGSHNWSPLLTGKLCTICDTNVVASMHVTVELTGGGRSRESDRMGEIFKSRQPKILKKIMKVYFPLPIGHFRVPKTLTFKMRLGAQLFLWKWVLFAWEWKIISISKVEHLPSFWNRDPGELGNGLLLVVWSTKSLAILCDSSFTEVHLAR